MAAGRPWHANSPLDAATSAHGDAGDLTPTPNDAAQLNAFAFSHNADTSAAEPPRANHDAPDVPDLQIRKASAPGLLVQTDLKPSPLIEQAQDPLGLGTSDRYCAGHRIPSPIQTEHPPLTSRRSYEIAAGNGSPASSISSPAIGALNDITPLPSPVFADTLSIWKRSTGRPHSGSSASVDREKAAGVFSSAQRSYSPPRKKKTYQNLIFGTSPADSQPTSAHDSRKSQESQRSISEYIPDQLHNFRPRNVTAPVSNVVRAEPGPFTETHHMHREEYLSRQRGLSVCENDPTKTLPSPPPSNKSITDSEDGDDALAKLLSSRFDSLTIRTASPQRRPMRWRPLRRLGEGTFSHVLLAVSEDVAVANASFSTLQETNLDPASLVAIKIVSHSKSGGADEERMETSIKREIDVLASIKHPCLPQMLGFEDDDVRAHLVLNYCRGGDLFEAASQHKELMTPPVIQRIFAELVAAVRYLHNQSIVHRDIKLENVLLTHPLIHLSNLTGPLSHYPQPLITLTDLGLSKRIPPPPESPLLTQRCGSIDYTAPEILLGQRYDGRSTDAWALGVLLYALMEGRLPFDSLPGKRPTSVKHRIARCDWLWCAFGDEDGDWVGGKGAEVLEGAREVVEGLLKKLGRGRWSLGMVCDHAWVKGGIQVEGGLTAVGT